MNSGPKPPGGLGAAEPALSSPSRRSEVLLCSETRDKGGDVRRFQGLGTGRPCPSSFIGKDGGMIVICVVQPPFFALCQSIKFLANLAIPIISACSRHS